MQCEFFSRGACRSCTLMGQAYDAQLADKVLHCRQTLAAHAAIAWLPPVPSAESGYRNKAKMVVSGTAERPVLGIGDREGAGVDLADCPLYPDGLRAAFPALADLIGRATLTPYDVARRQGELKYLLVTVSPDDELMTRFVLRSQEPVARLRKHLPGLLAALPQLRVASVNLQPVHQAVLEGDREILLTEQSTLPMRLNGIELGLRPQSFFQTNTDVAAALYRQVCEWVRSAAPASIWDLYCGVGGFALHCADGVRDVLGVEVSGEAVASAEASREHARLAGVRFVADDATAFALRAARPPDLVIVNPPRRGIGPELAGWLERSDVRTVVYSSCNAVSLARDLEAMPGLHPVAARVLDMFPQTSHYEVVTLLERG